MPGDQKEETDGPCVHPESVEHGPRPARRSALWAGLPARADAHVGGRVFPIPELTDEMLAVIQLDGDVHEWFDQIGEPALTSVDFLNTGKNHMIRPTWTSASGWLGTMSRLAST